MVSTILGKGDSRGESGFAVNRGITVFILLIFLLITVETYSFLWL